MFYFNRKIERGEKGLTLPSIGKDRKELELLHTVGGNTKFYLYFGETLSVCLKAKHLLTT